MFELISRWIYEVVHSPNFSIGSITAIVGVILTAVGLWPIFKERRRNRWLEKNFGADFFDSEAIKRAVQYYVRPNCSSVDPANEAEISQIVATEEDLFSTVTRYLAKDTPHRHLLVLADSGMGKTSFVISYYAHNMTLPKRKRQRLAIVPLGIPDALTEIAKIEDKKNTVIFLDAFDEDTRAIKDHRARLNELMQACSQFKRVLITCRTQFFPKDEEIPQQTGITRIAPRLLGEKAVYEFLKLYLTPLNDQQVNTFIRKRYPAWRWRKREKARTLVRRIPLLSVRPMLLAYIPDLLESGTKEFHYAFQIYEVMVRKWLERESGWIQPNVLLTFSENLAVNMYLGRAQRQSERITRVELSEIVREHNLSLEGWKVTGRTLLNRDAVGNLKFAHRSIMEYLFIKSFATGDRRTSKAELTDNMKCFLIEMIHSAWKTKNTPLPTYKNSDLLNAPHLPLAAIYTLRAQPKQIADLSNEFRKMGFTPKGFNFLYEHIYVPEERNQTSIVTDYATGLQWQQSGSEVPLIQESSEQYIWTMNDSGYAGYANWRLPTLAEVLAMIGDENSAREDTPVFDSSIDSFWVADFLAGSEGALAIFKGTSQKLRHIEPNQILQSVSVRGEEFNLAFIPTHSNGTAFVKAVRNLTFTEGGIRFVEPSLAVA